MFLFYQFAIGRIIAFNRHGVSSEAFNNVSTCGTENAHPSEASGLNFPPYVRLVFFPFFSSSGFVHGIWVLSCVLFCGIGLDLRFSLLLQCVAGVTHVWSQWVESNPIYQKDTLYILFYIVAVTCRQNLGNRDTEIDLQHFPNKLYKYILKRVVPNGENLRKRRLWYQKLEQKV